MGNSAHKQLRLADYDFQINHGAYVKHQSANTLCGVPIKAVDGTELENGKLFARLVRAKDHNRSKPLTFQLKEAQYLIFKYPRQYIDELQTVSQLITA